MAEIARMTRQGTLRLPAGIAAHFRPTDRFLVWVEGDTLHLKQIDAPSDEGVGQAPTRARTPLGSQLQQARAKIVASGEPLLDWAEIEEEIVSRRGGQSQVEPK